MTNDQNNNRENENFLFGKDKKLPFIVPEGYFGAFEALLRMKIEVLEELEEFPALSALDKEKNFVVPRSYFRESKNELEVKCELSDFSMLSTIPKRKAEDVKILDPEAILGSVNELKEFKTLSGLEKVNRFEVGPEYFDNSSSVIREAVQASTHPQAKVIPIFFRPKMVMAYAAAIVITVCAVFYYNNVKQEMLKGDCETLACLERNEILNEKTIHEFSEEELYDMVDEAELDAQLLTVDSLSVNE